MKPEEEYSAAKDAVASALTKMRKKGLAIDLTHDDMASDLGDICADAGFTGWDIIT